MKLITLVLLLLLTAHAVAAPTPARIPAQAPTTTTPHPITGARVDVTCTSAGSAADGYLEIAISSGSGFVVDDDLVVTAASVVTPTRCASGERPTVVVRAGAGVIVSAVEMVDAGSGIALVRAPGARGARVAASDAARRGTRVCAVISAPAFAVSCGDVSGVARGRRAWLSAVAPLGSGGAPVVDAAGRVVGVLTSTARCTSGKSCGTIVEPIPEALLAIIDRVEIAGTRDSVAHEAR
jgi:hypothetical protein